MVPAVFVEVRSQKDTDAAYRRRLARARTYGVPEVLFVTPHAPGGVRIDHLVADPDDPQRYRVAAVSASEDFLVVVPTLGIRLAGGRELKVWDNGTPWPTTAQAFLQARTAAAEAARADHEAARAERLAAQLRAAGLEPAG